MTEICDDPVVPDRPAIPPSLRITADLRRRIEAGEWASGEQLPPIAELAAEYGNARRTVTKALRVLEAEGLIVITPNWGTHRT